MTLKELKSRLKLAVWQETFLKSYMSPGNDSIYVISYTTLERLLKVDPEDIPLYMASVEASRDLVCDEPFYPGEHRDTVFPVLQILLEAYNEETAS